MRVWKPVVALVGVAACSWFALRPTGDEVLGVRAPLSAQTEARPATRTDLAEPPDAAHALRDLGEHDSREVAVPVVLGGIVTSAEGEAVAGATVSWTPIPPDFRQPWVRRDDIEELVVESTIYEHTDADGRFGFGRSPHAGEHGFVLWITHPEFEARAVHVPAEREAWPNQAAWKMVPAAAARVRVVEGASTPVSGAIVTQVGLESILGDTALPPRAAWLLRRELATGADGTVRLAPLRGRHRVEAVLEGRVSPPWEGEPLPEVTLRLGGAFVLGGSSCWLADVSESTRVFVTCYAVRGPHVTQLTRTRVTRDSWGPMSVPLTGAPEYRLRLDGDGVIPQTHEFFAPSPGAALRFNFDVRLGHVLWFMALDLEGNVVPDAEATVRWVADGQREELSVGARPDGYMAVNGCPSGTVIPSFRAPGYSPMEIEPIELPLDEEQYFEVLMAKAGSVRVTVTDGSVPQQDFTILVWPPERPQDLARYIVQGSREGVLELSEVPVGEVGITAVSVGASQAAPRTITVVAGQLADVQLEVRKVLAGVGRVVDAVTGSPVAGAAIRVQATDGLRGIDAFGPPRLAGPDGTFEVFGVAHGRALVSVSAPGYSTKTAVSRSGESDAVDFGDVALFYKQSLSVRLRHDLDVDPTRFRVAVEGPDGTFARMFDKNGEARFDHLSAGRHSVTAYYPDRTWRHVTEQFVAGDVWHVEFDTDADAGATLRIEVLDDRGDVLVPNTWVELKMPSETDWACFMALLDSDGRAAISRLPAGSFQVSVYSRPDTGSRLLASERINLVSGEDARLQIRLGKDRRRFRIVDGVGGSLAGVSLSINTPGSDLSWPSIGASDEDGLCGVFGLGGYPQLFAHLAHSERGYSLGLPVGPALSDGITELVFREPVETNIVLARRTGPVVGVRGRFCDFQLARRVLGPATDESGRAVWANLSPGEYVFVFDDKGYWPIYKPVTVAAGAPEVRVELYRLCNVRVVVRRGVDSLSGVTVELQRLGGVTPLAAFVETGQVQSSTSSMDTDADGTLRLEGVAEGRYSWRVTLPGGARFEGEFEVEPDGLVDLLIEL